MEVVRQSKADSREVVAASGRKAQIMRAVRRYETLNAFAAALSLFGFGDGDAASCANVWNATRAFAANRHSIMQISR